MVPLLSNYSSFCMQKDEALWENIVDITTKYSFEVELDHQFLKKKMAGIRPDYSSAENSKATGLKYLSFQYLGKFFPDSSRQLLMLKINGFFWYSRQQPFSKLEALWLHEGGWSKGNCRRR